MFKITKMVNFYYFILATVIGIISLYLDRFLHENISARKSVILHAIGLIPFLGSFFLLLIKDFKETNFVYLGIFLIILGIILMFLALINLGSNLILFKGIVNYGIYKYIRHPFYLSTIILFLGFSILASSIYGIIYTVITSLMLYNLARYEEKRLIKKLKGYKEYMSKTKMFIPKFQ